MFTDISDQKFSNMAFSGHRCLNKTDWNFHGHKIADTDGGTSNESSKISDILGVS